MYPLRMKWIVVEHSSVSLRDKFDRNLSATFKVIVSVYSGLLRFAPLGISLRPKRSVTCKIHTSLATTFFYLTVVYNYINTCYRYIIPLDFETVVPIYIFMKKPKCR